MKIKEDTKGRFWRTLFLFKERKDEAK